MALQFLRGQMTIPPMPQANLTGQTILVTGANSGLGLDAAKLLARMNCSTIVLACRSFAKGEKAKEEILRSTPGSKREEKSIIIFELDLGSYESVVAFSERCKDLPRLDAVILNAGVHTKDFSVTQGFETMVTVNVISTFLLIILLIPTLRVCARTYKTTPTIAVVGSAVHFWAKEKNLTSPSEGQILKSNSDPKKTTDMGQQYYVSKLLVMLLVKYLAQVVSDSAQQDRDGKPLVVINNVAPGLCKTNLFRDLDDASVRVLLRMIGRESEHGARTLVHGAIAGKESHGQYLSECKVKKYSDFVKSAEGDRTAARVWRELSAIYEEVKPGCTTVL